MSYDIGETDPLSIDRTYRPPKPDRSAGTGAVLTAWFVVLVLLILHGAATGNPMLALIWGLGGTITAPLTFLVLTALKYMFSD